jgi:hypothetical protein
MPFFGRLLLALRTFFSILFNGAPALNGGGTSEIAPPNEGSKGLLETDSRSAVQLLGALQREGRLVDFLMDEVEGASDADIGVAARVIHRGCRQVIEGYFDLAPAYPGIEGERVTIEAGYDPSVIEVVGSVAEAPFTGVLNHQGWMIRTVKLPSLTSAFSATLLQRAEVER